MSCSTNAIIRIPLELSYRQEVKDLIEDLAWKGFKYCDLRWNQFVFAPNASVCSRHLRKHEFHLVDFAMVDRIPLNEADRKHVQKAMLKEGPGDLSFWGIGPWLN